MAENKLWIVHIQRQLLTKIRTTATTRENATTTLTTTKSNIELKTNKKYEIKILKIENTKEVHPAINIFAAQHCSYHLMKY